MNNKTGHQTITGYFTDQKLNIFVTKLGINRCRMENTNTTRKFVKEQ